MQGDPLARYREKKQEAPQDDPLARYRPKKEEKKSRGEENNIESAIRHSARTGSRAAETVLGFRGDIKKLGNKAGLYVLEKALGERSPEQREQLMKSSGDVFTSEGLKNISKKATGGYTTADTPGEKSSDEIASFASALVSGKGVPSGAKALVSNIGKAVATSVASVGAGDVVKALGGGETGKEITKIGTSVLLSLINPGGLKQAISNNYKQARSEIPKGTMLSTAGFSKSLKDLKTDLKTGISTPSKEPILKIIDELEKKAASGQMEASEVVDIWHNINEIMSSRDLWSSVSGAGKERLRSNFNNLKKVVGSEIESYGQYNPKFLESWKAANEGYASNAASTRITDFMNGIVKKSQGGLYPALAIKLFTGNPAAAVPIALGAGTINLGQMLYRVFKSPSLRKYYGEVVANAAKENVKGTIQALNRLDDSLKKQKANLSEGPKGAGPHRQSKPKQQAK